MLYKLICLCLNGVLLSKEQLAEAPTYTGNLIIEDWREGNAAGRALRQARFRRTDNIQAQSDLLPPVFDPVLVKMTDKQMTLHGFVINVENGIVTYYSQYWVLQMVRQE
jgi:hypothetical protein